MKKAYSTPCLYIEEFATNRAVATTCSQTTLSFVCTTGPDTPRAATVVSSDISGSGCSTNVGYFEGNTVTNSTSVAQGKTPAIRSASGWTTTGSYTYKYNGAEALLYACYQGSGDNSSSATYAGISDWTKGSTLTHSVKKSAGHHAEVCPVTRNVRAAS